MSVRHIGLKPGAIRTRLTSQGALPRAVAAGLVITIGLVAGVATAATSGAAAVRPSLKTEAVPTATASVEPNAVTTLPGSKEAILVGTSYGQSTSSDLAELWNGSKWTTMKIVNSPSNGGLSGVWAASDKDAWAVGGDSNGGQVLHWTGGSWSEVTVPGLPSGAYLKAVSGTSSSNIWVVGSSFAGQTTTPLEAHFNGTTWTVLQQGGSGVYLNSVSVVSSGAAWAAGGNTNKGTPAVLEYGGSSWSPAATGIPADAALSSISDRGGKAWVVGAAYKSSVSTPVAMSWNGSKWVASKVARPKNGISPRLNGVVTLGSTAWAVGDYQPTSTTFSALVEQYSGGKWKLVTLPSLPKQSVFSAVAGVTSDLWVVGFRWTGKVCASSLEPVVYHHTTSWQQKSPASPLRSISPDVPTC